MRQENIAFVSLTLVDEVWKQVKKIKMETSVWLLGIIFIVAFLGLETVEAQSLQCSLCTPENARNMGKKDTFIERGCDDPSVREKPQPCSSAMCDWKILHDPRPEEILQKNGKKTNATKQAGWLASKGCDSRVASNIKPGTCRVMKHLNKYRYYHCHCNADLCNKGLPSCKWIKDADPSNKNPKGCAADTKAAPPPPPPKPAPTTTQPPKQESSSPSPTPKLKTAGRSAKISGRDMNADKKAIVYDHKCPMINFLQQTRNLLSEFRNEISVFLVADADVEDSDAPKE